MSNTRLVFAAALLMWLVLCGSLISHEIDHPATLGITFTAIALFGPFFLMRLSRLPVYFIAAYAALVPFNDVLVTGTGTMFMRVLGVATAGCILFAIAATQQVVKPTRAVLATFGLTVYAGASIWWAIDPVVALASYEMFLSYVAFFVVLCLYPVDLNGMKIILAGAVLGGLVAAAFGDLLFIQGAAHAVSRIEIKNGAHETDYNLFATALIMPLALVLMLFLRSPWFLKCIWFAALLTMLYGFVATSSRGAAISFGAMVVFLALRSRYRRQLLFIGATAAIVILTSPLTQRFMSADFASADLRVDIWKVALASLRQYWLLGAGTGNFEAAFAQFYLSTPHAPLFWEAAPHSELIRSAVEWGIPGVILVVALWYLVFRELAHVQASGLTADICLGLRAGILGLFVSAFSLDLWMIKYTWVAFALAIMMRTALQAQGVPVERPARDRVDGAKHGLGGSGPAVAFGNQASSGGA
jgi:hypothetical protein